MMDLVIIAVVFAIVCLAAGYVIYEKKKGTKCIGCPMSGNCGGKACHSKQQDGVKKS